MATKATTSSTRLLAIGALVLVVGVILVLLVLRGNVGGPSAAAPGQATGDAADATVAATTETDVAPAVVPTTVEELAAVRLPLPASVPDGYEGVAVQASFVRGLAAVPTPGDRVNLYRAAETTDAGVTGVAGPDTAAGEPVTELVLPDLEVLALIGPLPTQNEGHVTFLVAVAPEDIGTLLPVAGSGEVWFTLLPQAATDAEDQA